MTRAEIFKVGVTHYFKPDKARDELGYSPLIPMKTGMQRVVQYYQEKRNNQRQSGSFPYTLFAVLLVAVIVGIFINNGLSYWTFILYRDTTQESKLLACLLIP